MNAMLLCSGEAGYRHVAVRDVYERYGGYRTQFYRHFANKADCFAAAYEAETERICKRILTFLGEKGSKADRFQAALSDLAEFVENQPELAKALFMEVHVAGGAALAKRQEAIERLSRAIDDACRETKSRHSPPPTTAEFIIGAVEQAVSSSLLEAAPEALKAAVPELTVLFRDIYYSDAP